MDKFIDTTNLSFGEKFVYRYPNMFTSDHNFWVRELNKFHNDQITQLQSSNEELKKDLKAYKESFETNKEQFMELATHAKDLEIENSHLRQRLEAAEKLIDNHGWGNDADWEKWQSLKNQEIK